MGYLSPLLSLDRISQHLACWSGAKSPAAFFNIQNVNRHCLLQKRRGLPPVRFRDRSDTSQSGLVHASDIALIQALTLY